MQLNMKPQRILHLTNFQASCFLDTAMTACYYHGIEYRIIFAKDWNVYFDPPSPEKQKINERFRFVDYNFELWEEYVGMEFTRHDSCDKTSLLRDIKHNLLERKQSVIITIDAFYVPWDPNYNLRHSPHTAMVDGYNPKTNEVILCDPFYNVTGESMSFDILSTACDSYMEYNLKKPKRQIGDFRQFMRTELYNGMNLECDYTTYDQLRQLGRELALYCSNELIKSYDPVLSAVEITLRDLILIRNKYMVFLQCAADHGVPIPEEIYDEIRQIIFDLDIIDNMVSKINYKGRCTPRMNQRLVLRFNTLADSEECLINRVLASCGETDHKSSEYIPAAPGSSADRYYPDLLPLFNNKAFGFAPNQSFNYMANIKIKGDFCDKHGYFSITPNSIQHLDEKRFLWSQHFDNLTCLGQSVQLKEGIYKTISIVGCTDDDRFYSEILWLKKDEQLVKAVDIRMVGYTSDESEQDIPYWISERYFWEEDGEQQNRFSSNIFIHTYQLCTDMPVNKLVLPNNPHAHIFLMFFE